jgi:hypothetical protein
MSEVAAFQSVLRQLSAMPPENWVVVERLLSKMAVKAQRVGKDPKGILQFAGSWATWEDHEFYAFLSDLQEQRNHWFSRDFIS